jgi:hypothetical protein
MNKIYYCPERDLIGINTLENCVEIEDGIFCVLNSIWIEIGIL